MTTIKVGKRQAHDTRGDEPRVRVYPELRIGATLLRKIGADVGDELQATVRRGRIVVKKGE